MISVIIPNYNNDKFIGDCLDSVLAQTYTDIEIIVVDDGSSDNSVAVIRKYCESNNNIKLICQKNLNAAIARNRGLSEAKGEFVMFLDSDDFLEKNALENLLNSLKSENADLAIGGYKEIDVDGKLLGFTFLPDEKNVCGKEKIVKELSKLGPIPSNKLYRMDIIRRHDLCWGNVRIGQDLNFYLKYLSCCKKVALINKNIFLYRITANSVSRSFDFRIFDIVNSLADVKRYYALNGNSDLYDKYLIAQEAKHYNNQLAKQRNFKSRAARRIVFDYFMFFEKQIKYDKIQKMDKETRCYKRKFKVKRLLKPLYISPVIRIIRKKG